MRSLRCATRLTPTLSTLKGGEGGEEMVERDGKGEEGGQPFVIASIALASFTSRAERPPQSWVESAMSTLL